VLGQQLVEHILVLGQLVWQQSMLIVKQVKQLIILLVEQQQFIRGQFRLGLIKLVGIVLFVLLSPQHHIQLLEQSL
jgi:hypothetical protein